MRVLVLAPHQDDEILGACILMQKCLDNGDRVFVAYATNGDYHGKEIAVKRYFESRAALHLLGLSENCTFYLGYGDTGMGSDHSFLSCLSRMDEGCLHPSPISTHTYHPAGRQTVHYLCTKQEAAYRRDSFLEDIRFLLDLSAPDVIVLPSCYDIHGDHCTCFHLLGEVLENYRYRPILLSYLLHAGDDTLWPNRDASTFHRPLAVKENVWNKRLILQATEQERQMKLACIQCFQSQGIEDINGYLLSFAKYEEWFLPFPGQPTINIFPWLK